MTPAEKAKLHGEPKAQIVVTLLPNGEIKVDGPLDQKMICYSLLEMGKDLVRDFKPSILSLRNRG